MTSKSIYNLRNIEKNLEIKIRSTHEDYMNKEGSYLKLSTKESLNNRTEYLNNTKELIRLLQDNLEKINTLDDMK